MNYLQDVSTALICIFLVYVSYKLAVPILNYIKFRFIFPGPRVLSYLGGHEIVDLAERNCQKFEKYVIEYPRMFRLLYGPFIRIDVVCPELAREVMKHSEQKDMFIINLLTPWLGKGLVMHKDPNPVWQRNRKLLTPLFHVKTLKHFCDTFNSTADNLVRVLSQYEYGNEINFSEHARLATFEAVLNTICSKDCDIQLNPHNENIYTRYMELLDLLTELMNSRFKRVLNMFDFLFYRTEAGKKTLKCCDEMRQIITDLIEERERVDSTNREYNDMLDIMMKSRDENGRGLNHREIVDELSTFIFGGHDTTYSALTFLMYFLSKHTEWQSRCRDEVTSVIGDRESFSWDDLPKLVITGNCIKEALRLYPPAPRIKRIITQAVTLDGWTLPVGTMVDVDTYSIHHNPTVWEDPTRFDPTRFMKESLEEKHEYSFIPFSVGARSCIGQQYALSELKILTAKLLRAFEFSLVPGFQLSRGVSLVLCIQDGLRVLIKQL